MGGVKLEVGNFLSLSPYLLFGSSKFGTETSKSGGHALFVLTVKEKTLRDYLTCAKRYN